MGTIIKLGGSVWAAGELDRWLDCIAICNAPGIIVPGGGVFADGVRQAQRPLADGHEPQFNARTAHDMAILAMHQFGLIVAERLSGYRRVLSLDDATACIAESDQGIWLPNPHELAQESHIEASWEMTSDALAVWLAAHLGVSRVVLIKSLSAAELNVSMSQAVASKFVDGVACQLGSRFDVSLQLLGTSEQSRLQEILGS